MADQTMPWFFGAVAYQIYPRSFYDSNGNGVGDLRGIIDKLDYLGGTDDSLGVDVIWICPFYKSPMADFGYDISDYSRVDPLFGTLDDFKQLVQEAHKRGIKVFVDLVVNHTSDEHAWFKESKVSRSSPRRDWYIWRDGRPNGLPPNNWRSVFGGSAWEYDSMTNQYYLHTFSVKQADLNWENPEVRQAVRSIVRFWLKLGVDGFRADAVYWLSKDYSLRNDPPNPDHTLDKPKDYDALVHNFSVRGPRLYDYLNEITDLFDDYGGSFMVVEADPEGSNVVEEYLKFYKYVDNRRNAPFNFKPLHLAGDMAKLKQFIDEFQSQLDPEYLPVYTLGNHDQPRLANRVGPEALRKLAMMLLTLPGMPFIYYGEEIGMSDVAIPVAEQNDPQASYGKGRDGARTPMQWSNQPNGGFSTVRPWLPVPENYKEVNVAAQLGDQRSLLSLYRDLIRLRKASRALKYGVYHPLSLNPQVFSYIREVPSQKMLIVLNCGVENIEVSSDKLGRGSIVLSTHSDVKGSEFSGSLKLRPNEGLIISLDME